MKCRKGLNGLLSQHSTSMCMRTTLPYSTPIICDRLLLTTFNTGDVEAPPPVTQVRQLITLNPAYSIPDIVAIGCVFSHTTFLVFQASIRIFSYFARFVYCNRYFTAFYEYVVQY